MVNVNTHYKYPKDAPISQRELWEYADNFLQRNFNVPCQIPIELNGYLTTCLGRFIAKKCYGRYFAVATEGLCSVDVPIKIELNRNMVYNSSKEDIYDTLKHELIHYYLCSEGKPYGDDTGLFTDLCTKLQVGLTNTASPKMLLNLYKCPTCGYTFKMNKHYRRTKIYCRRCKTQLEYVGKKVM